MYLISPSDCSSRSTTTSSSSSSSPAPSGLAPPRCLGRSRGCCCCCGPVPRSRCCFSTFTSSHASPRPCSSINSNSDQTWPDILRCPSLPGHQNTLASQWTPSPSDQNTHTHVPVDTLTFSASSRPGSVGTPQSSPGALLAAALVEWGGKGSRCQAWSRSCSSGGDRQMCEQAYTTAVKGKGRGRD